MDKRFVDVEYLREKVEEETLKVKSGIRAGEYDWPPGYPYYGFPPDDLPPEL
jgi:hypothetical protein